MNKLIKITISEEIREEFGNLVINPDGEGFFNPAFISQLFFTKEYIYFILGPSIETGTPICLRFSENSMDEYHRVRREIEEAMIDTQKLR